MSEYVANIRGLGDAERILQNLESRGLLSYVDRQAAIYYVTPEQICGRRRSKQVAAARHAVWRELHSLGFSMNEIAYMWGVNHTSVLAAVRK